MDSRRFEDDEVLRSVIDTLQWIAGDDPKVDITTILVEFQEEVCDSLFHEEIVLGIEERLGICMSHQEWMAFYQLPNGIDNAMPFEKWRNTIAPTLTVTALADFLRERFKPVSFEPVSVLGSPPCQAAGYFVGMSDIVQQIQPEATRFGPSTSIRSVLPNSRLRVFWSRLSRAANKSLPPLSFWLNHLANALLIISIGFLAFGIMVDWAILASVWLLCLKGLQLGWWLHHRANPLPYGINTFGDLARYLAGKRTPHRAWRFGNRLGSLFRRKQAAEST